MYVGADGEPLADWEIELAQHEGRLDELSTADGRGGRQNDRSGDRQGGDRGPRRNDGRNDGQNDRSDRKSTRLNSSHSQQSRMPSSA